MNSPLGILRALYFIVFALSLSAFGATRTLTLATNGSGSIVANPSSPAYPQNSVVTLTATPFAGWLFNGWSGSISGSTNPTNVLMDTDKTITGNFSQVPSYTLN